MIQFKNTFKRTCFRFHSKFYQSVPIPTNKIGTNVLSKSMVVALVGRPNVGKSTLFNRLARASLAITSDIPGTTRDKKDCQCTLGGVDFILYDTGGLDENNTIGLAIQRQVAGAIRSSDIIFFLVDGKSGITAMDLHFSKWLRKLAGELPDDSSKTASGAVPKEIFVMVNKTEGTKLSDQTLEVLHEALSFGFGDPIPISAAHGEGLSDIAEIIVQSARKRGYPIQSGAKTVDVDHEAVTMTPKALEDRMIQIAIMGRPNVGKSSILNAVLGSERVIVGPVPGLTRLDLIKFPSLRQTMIYLTLAIP